MLTATYLLSLAPEEQRAYLALERLMEAVNIITERRWGPGVLFTQGNEMHQHFPVFAKAMGLQGPLYESENGKCPAVTLYDNGNTQYIIFWPTSIVGEMSLEEGEEKEKIMSAAIAFVKALRPHSNWDA